MTLSGISVRSVIGRVLRAPLGMIPPGTVVPIVQGPLRGKKWIVGSSLHGFWLGSFEHKKQKALEQALKPGDVVFDLGAHVGFYTLLAASLVKDGGHVYCFEPLQRNLEYIRKHISLNKITNCTVIEAAVGSRDGQAWFNPSPSPSMGHLSPAGEIPVRTRALDSALRSGEVRPPDLMKIDIEGGELEALEGSQEILKSFGPTIFLATHGQTRHDACVRLLRAAGYELKSLNKRPVDSTDELIATPGHRLLQG